MDSTSAETTIVAAALPHELYHDIIENLTHPMDRRSLLILSLVNKTWSDHVQRALFKEFCDDWIDERDKEIVRARHTRFLSSVIGHPTHLGPHVRTYGQFGLAGNVTNPNSSRLLELTIEALPAMVNLQNLHIVPAGACPMPPNLFENCTFQLRSLTLLVGVALSGPFLDFLRTQPEIRHLCIDPSMAPPFQVGLSGLPENVCPNLVSISCVYDSIVQGTKKRNVIALDTMADFQKTELPQLGVHDLNVGRLRYLGLWTHACACPGDSIRMAENDICIVNVDIGDFHAVVNGISAQRLSDIRVLVLLNTDALGMASKPKFRRFVLESFSHFPKLECVVSQGLFTMNSMYNQPSVTHHGNHIGSSDAQYEQIRTNRNQARPWWTLHDDV